VSKTVEQGGAPARRSGATGSSTASDLLRNRGFLGYLATRVTARSATTVVGVCVVWLVFAVTNSALDVAVVGVAETVSAIVFALPAGTWVDRYDRRTLLIVTNASRAACFGVLVGLLSVVGFTLLVLVGVVFLWSGVSELYRSLSYAILPDIVNVRQLTDANGIDRAALSIIGASSNALAGVLILVLGTIYGFAFGAGTYAVAAVLTALLIGLKPSIRDPANPVAVSTDGRRNRRSTREGFRWLRTQPGLLQLALSATAFNFIFSVAFYFFVVYVAVALRGGALIFGGSLAVYSVGYAVGGLLVGRTTAMAHAGKVWVVVYGGLSGTGLLIMGLVPNDFVALSSFLGIGFAVGFAGNVWLTSAQTLVPAEMRGRYFAIDGLLSFVAGPPAIVAGGVLVELFGVVSVYLWSGLLMLVSALGFAATMKSLWNLDGRTPVT
jgi:MFS family permease